MHFILIVHNLYQNIPGLLIPEKDNLYISSHRNYLEITPYLINFIRIANCNITILYPHQRNQRNHITIVPEAESSGNSPFPDSLVSTVQNIS